MRVECESCKTLVVATFAIDGTSLRATCPECTTTMTLETGQRADDRSVGPMLDAGVGGPSAPTARTSDCPKCGAPTEGQAACSSCGLAADRMAQYADARDAAAPESVRAAWDRVVEGWGDPACHDELLKWVAVHGCYAWAAGRYRDAGRSRSGDPVIARQLGRLARAAEATLLATASVRPEPASRTYRAASAVLAALVIVIVAGLVYAMVIRARGPLPVRDPTMAQPARTLAPVDRPGRDDPSEHPVR